MPILEIVPQPYNGSSVRKLIGDVLLGGGIAQLDVAAAYVTTGGVRDLLKTVHSALGTAYPDVEKRWLVAFDYCRSEPLALSLLANEPGSRVRVHDAKVLLGQNCIPFRPFHPKTFLFTGPVRQAVFCGSGNISLSGMNTGHEVGLLVDSKKASGDTSSRVQIAKLQSWYKKMWADAFDLTPSIAADYKSIYDSNQNLKNPTPTDDDDISKIGTGSYALTPLDLRKLRACSHFWIEAGNITKNLGNGPGNQLMMKRLSRVFFGVPATHVPQNSWLSLLSISYDSHPPKNDCSLTFSDNGMDKLTLPLPGNGGPAMYDNEVLLFTRQWAGSFALTLGSAKDKSNWLAKSKGIEASYKMPSGGRKWGVF